MAGLPRGLRCGGGDRFSAAFVPGGQGRNRFDLPGNPRGVIYLAESEEHAVAEMIQAFRNSPAPLTNDDLTAWGHRLALVSVTVDPARWTRIADLCDPATLSGIGITADLPPLRDRKRTQQIAASLHASHHAGLRWWSAFWGEWQNPGGWHDSPTPWTAVFVKEEALAEPRCSKEGISTRPLAAQRYLPARQSRFSWQASSPFPPFF